MLNGLHLGGLQVEELARYLFDLGEIPVLDGKDLEIAALEELKRRCGQALRGESSCAFQCSLRRSMMSYRTLGSVPDNGRPGQGDDGVGRCCRQRCRTC